MGKLTSVEESDLTIFHQEQMEEMKKPTTADIKERHDELPSAYWNQAHQDRGTLLKRLEAAEQKLTIAYKIHPLLSEMVDAELQAIIGSK